MPCPTAVKRKNDCSHNTCDTPGCSQHPQSKKKGKLTTAVSARSFLILWSSSISPSAYCFVIANSFASFWAWSF